MLAELHGKIAVCEKCGLSRTRKNAVPGEGPENAEIMFIGEAPGAREDETGKPFCGRSGNLLTDVLREAGIERKDCFVTSPLKCRPPDNRLPKSEELRACRPWLVEQMKIIKPRVVCLLGNSATKALLGKTGVNGLHGKSEERDGINYFITFHPAAVIRGTVKRETYLEDMKMLKRMAGES